jgi:hypothetical protein
VNSRIFHATLRAPPCPLGFDDSDGKAAESGDVFRAIAGAYAAAIFIEIAVQDIVATAFNTPVATLDGEGLLGVYFARLSADDAVGDFFGLFFALFVYGFSFR